MRSCQKFSEVFSDYFEKALPEKDRQAVETHLQLCPPCQQSIARLVRLRQVLRALPVIKTSLDFDTVLRTRMRLERRRRRPLFARPISPRRTLAWGGLATIVVAGSMYLLLRQSSDSPPSQLSGHRSPFTPLISASAGLPGPAGLPGHAQLFYTLDGLTIRQGGGSPLQLSSAGVAEYQSAALDSAAPIPAEPTELSPVLISF